MNDAIKEAIARSISHNEIVTVEVTDPKEAARTSPALDWCAIEDGKVDVWGEDWRLLLVPEVYSIASTC